MDMDKVGWPLIIAIIGSLVATVVGGLILEFSKQFIPQLDNEQKAKTINSIKMIIRTIQGIIVGLLIGGFVASAFFNEAIYQSFDLPEATGPLTQEAPRGTGDTIQVPTGQARMTETGRNVIIVFGFIGGIIGFFEGKRQIGKGVDDKAK